MNVQELKPMLAALPSEDLNEIAQFVAERQADLWDEQIEADAKAGRLDELFAQALASHRAGKSRSMDEILGEDTPANGVPL